MIDLLRIYVSLLVPFWRLPAYIFSTKSTKHPSNEIKKEIEVCRFFPRHKQRGDYRKIRLRTVENHEHKVYSGKKKKSDFEKRYVKIMLNRKYFFFLSTFHTTTSSDVDTSLYCWEKNVRTFLRCVRYLPVTGFSSKGNEIFSGLFKGGHGVRRERFKNVNDDEEELKKVKLVVNRYR